MKILVTGAGGFVGKNLCAALRTLKDCSAPHPDVEEVFLFEKDDPAEKLADYCAQCDFVFHLAGVNRSGKREDFYSANGDFTAGLLAVLREKGNCCPVMISSSVQATLAGRYDGDYGKSKLEGEKAAFDHAQKTGAKVLVYRFPNLFGKWGRPSYNSVVATFCSNISRGLAVVVDNPAAEIELAYIDDVVAELISALSGKETRCDFDENGVKTFNTAGKYCTVAVTEKVTVGKLKSLIEEFASFDKTITVPAMPSGSFVKKLYSTYLSYIPAEKAAVELNMHSDARGSFTELLKIADGGQFSVNVALPGVTKGQHWHNSKWEIFVVVSGEGVIRQRCVLTDEVYEIKVSGERPVAVRMLPGYTHSIENTGATAPLVTLMWANEQFDARCPDTFYEKV